MLTCTFHHWALKSRKGKCTHELGVADGKIHFRNHTQFISLPDSLAAKEYVHLGNPVHFKLIWPWNILFKGDLLISGRTSILKHIDLGNVIVLHNYNYCPKYLTDLMQLYSRCKEVLEVT